LGVAPFASKNDLLFKCLRTVFSCVTTRAERDEILEQVRAGDRVVHREPFA
jgi:hypothetical protein